LTLINYASAATFIDKVTMVLRKFLKIMKR